MSGDPRGQAVTDLFRAALERPPEDRASFLEESSPSVELRNEVERLLRESTNAGPPDNASPTPDSQTSSLQPGERVGPYRLEGILGEGGMGVVYKAIDTRLGRTVVLKFLHPHEAATHARLSRFLLEARAASALNHPGIVTIYEASEFEGTAFIAMEYVQGRTLRQQLRRERGALTAPDAIGYGIQMADAMAAHQQGILHRDLKPANVMVNARGQIKILDLAWQRSRRGRSNGRPATGRSLM